MWLSITIALTICFVAVAIRLRPTIAIGVIVPMSFVLPSWTMLHLLDGPNGTIVGTGIDLKLAVGTCCLVGYCFIPGRTFPWKLVPSDFMMLALLGSHLMSDLHHGQVWWLTISHCYAEWWVPYIAGRLAIQSAKDLQVFPLTVVVIGLVVGFAGTLEALSGINVFETVYGIRPVEGFSREASRWGLKRAFGSTLHPIYFGVLQLCLLGFAVFATQRSLVRKASPVWLFATIPLILGVVATGSRGPILGLMLACVLFAFANYKSQRIWMAGAMVVLVVIVVLQRESIINQLEIWSGESNRPHQEIIEVEQEGLKHSGTRNRLNILDVYKIALNRSGFFGFGTDAVSGFPINVPVGPREAATLKRTKYIDNTYVLMTLRFGYIGVTLFILAAVVSLFQFVFVADQHAGTLVQAFAAAMFATVGAISLVLFTVWMPYEIQFPLVWTWGISSGLMHWHMYVEKPTRSRSVR